MSEDNRALYAPPPIPAPKSKWCESCNAWGSHFSDGHDDDELASDTEAKTLLQQAREKIGKA